MPALLVLPRVIWEISAHEKLGLKGLNEKQEKQIFYILFKVLTMPNHVFLHVK